MGSRKRIVRIESGEPLTPEQLQEARLKRFPQLAAEAGHRETLKSQSEEDAGLSADDRFEKLKEKLVWKGGAGLPNPKRLHGNLTHDKFGRVESGLGALAKEINELRDNLTKYGSQHQPSIDGARRAMQQVIREDIFGETRDTSEQRINAATGVIIDAVRNFVERQTQPDGPSSLGRGGNNRRGRRGSYRGNR